MLSESRIEQEMEKFDRAMPDDFNITIDCHSVSYYLQDAYFYQVAKHIWLAAIEAQEKAPTESGVEERDRLCKQYNDDKISLSALVELLWGAAYVQGAIQQAQEITLPTSKISTIKGESHGITADEIYEALK
jgi:hypothetical protein